MSSYDGSLWWIKYTNLVMVLVVVEEVFTCASQLHSHSHLIFTSTFTSTSTTYSLWRAFDRPSRNRYTCNPFQRLRWENITSLRILALNVAHARICTQNCKTSLIVFNRTAPCSCRLSLQRAFDRPSRNRCACNPFQRLHKSPDAGAERCTCSHLNSKLQNQSHCIQSHCALRLPAVQRIPQPRHSHSHSLRSLRTLCRQGSFSFQSAFYVLHNFVLNLGPIQLPPPWPHSTRLCSVSWRSTLLSKTDVKQPPTPFPTCHMVPFCCSHMVKLHSLYQTQS